MPARRYYVEVDGKNVRVPGVTTITKQLGWSSGGLMYWAWQNGYDGLTLDEARANAVGVGVVAHAMIEADVRELPTPSLNELSEEMRQQVHRTMTAWNRWRDNYGFKVIGSEQSLVDADLMYGGTFDLVLVGDRRGLVDYKTGNAVYPDHLCQLVAYGKLWNKANPDEPIDEYHLLRLSKDDGSFHHHCWEAVALGRAWDAFTYALELYRIEKKLKGML